MVEGKTKQEDERDVIIRALRLENETLKVRHKKNMQIIDKLTSELSRNNKALREQTRKTTKSIISLIENMIEHRGGMGNRIDAYNILDTLKGKKVYKGITLKRFLEKTK